MSQHEKALLEALESNKNEGHLFEINDLLLALSSDKICDLLEMLLAQERKFLFHYISDETLQSCFEKGNIQLKADLQDYFKESHANDQQQLDLLFSLGGEDRYRQGARLLDTFHHSDQIWENWNEEEPEEGDMEMAALDILDYFTEGLFDHVVQILEEHD